MTSTRASLQAGDALLYRPPGDGDGADDVIYSGPPEAGVMPFTDY